MVFNKFKPNALSEINQIWIVSRRSIDNAGNLGFLCFIGHEKIDSETDRQTDGRTEGRTDGHGSDRPDS